MIGRVISMKIKVINNSKNKLPKYTREGDSGLDLRADLDAPLWIIPGNRALIPTGIHMEIPKGYEGQVRGRSGLAIRHGIGIVNGLGTIDSNYVGDIGVILINHGEKAFKVENGDRIAQLVIAPVKTVELEEVNVLEDTIRGSEGYGSSGVE